MLCCDHALFHCAWAAEVWSLIRNKWPNMDWPTNRSQLFYMLFARNRYDRFNAWVLITTSVLWAIWKARNDKTFENIDKPPIVIAHLAVAAAEEQFFLA